MPEVGLAASVTGAPVHAELVLGLRDAAGKGLTVKVAALEVTLPFVFVKMQEY